MNETKPPILWLQVCLFIGTFVVTIIGVPVWGYLHGFSWPLILASILFLGANGMSITGGYHRLWAHNTYKAHWLYRLLYALFGAAALQNSILVWASGHRRHHRHCDDNDKDPYSAGRGFWFSHIGWMCRAYDSAQEDFSNAKDLQRDKIVMWQHNHYLAIALTMNIVPAILIGWLCGDIIGGVLLVGFWRLVVSHHTTFFINSLAHIWGRRPYTEQNSARDNDVLALLTYGEGYHNFHHWFQNDYRNGIRWWQFDPTKWLIWGSSKLGLTWDLKTTPEFKIREAMIQTKMNHAQSAMTNEPSKFAGWLEQFEKEKAMLEESIANWKQVRGMWLQQQRAVLALTTEQAKANAYIELERLTAKIKALECELTMQLNRVKRFNMAYPTA